MSLRGLSVLVTRPRGSARALRERLLRAGARVVELPLVAIDHTGPSPALDEAIARLSSFDWIAFTSVNGVVAFWRRLRGRTLPPRIRVAAVGRGTASALRNRRVRRSVLVPRRENAEGLLTALRRAIPRRGARILMPRSNLAAPTLPDGLRRLGHEVHDVVAYRTVPVSRPASRLLRVARATDVALLFSPSAVRGLAAARLVRTKVVCVGNTTAAAARRDGFRVSAIPADTTPRAMIDAFAHLGQKAPPPSPHSK